MAGLRRALGGIFRVQPRRAFWATKALDLAVTMLFLTGLAAMTGLDVFLNVAGGMRVLEPAADLALAAALLSAREDVALPREMVIFGEISLYQHLINLLLVQSRSFSPSHNLSMFY